MSRFDDNSAMIPLTTAASIACSSGPPPAIETDLMVFPWFEGEAATAVPGLDAAAGGDLGRALTSGEFAGKPFEMYFATLAPRTWHVRRIAIVSAGPRVSFGAAQARRLATAAGLAARARRVPRMAFVCRGARERMSAEEWAVLAQATAEGLVLAEFNNASYKTGDGPAPVPEWLVVAEGAPANVTDALARGRVLGDSSNRARALSNEPGNVLVPREFATRIAEIAAEGGVRAEILEPPALEKLGMGLLLGVAQGSIEPARLVVLRYDAPRAPGTARGPVLGLVGKGVTFDTGGISIKPAEAMDRMKDDMAGGAAVVGAMRAIGLLGAPIDVIGVIPIAENMPSGTAIRPGDVLRSAEGKTVEIMNTDAEGRLILGDALWYARQLGATHLVDVATLTGAVVVALGKITSGLFGTPDAWVDEVRQAGQRAGDPMWPLPVFDEYREQLKSEIADFTNTGGRPAGSITAALFLKEFTGNLPWAHLDIAGTAWAEEARPYQPKGATGVAVRSLASLATDAARWVGRI
jgi:leucyl aminopeptidase